MKSDGWYISGVIWQVTDNINQDLYDMWCLIYIKVFMKSDGLDISKFMWQVMAYIYQDLYDHWWLIYIYIYIKIYMTRDGL